MNFSDILNSTIASLICAAVIAISTYLFKLIKKHYKKDKILFWNNLFFYLSLFGVVHSAIFFRIDKCCLSPFSFGDLNNSIFFGCLIINIFGTIFHYYNAKNIN